MKKNKKLIALIIMLLMTFSAVYQGVAAPYVRESYAAYDSENDPDITDKKNSLSESVEYIDDESLTEGAKENSLFGKTQIKYADSVENTVYFTDVDWDEYACDYCYNKLSDYQKVYYDRIDSLVRAYMNQDIDALDTYKESKGIYVLPKVVYSDIEIKDDKGNSTGSFMPKEEATNVYKLYMTQHPIYYFVNSKFLVSTTGIYVHCYDEFADGEARYLATLKLLSQIDKWVEQAKAEPTEYLLEKKVHDLICENTCYDRVDTDAYINQSAYSMIINKSTVCAGYAKTFAILMNKLGYSTIAITGTNHAWNKVLFKDKWYNVDVTWDDLDSETLCKYTYFNLSDSEFGSGHTPFSYYDGLLPESKETYVPTKEDLNEKSGTPTDATPTDATPTDATPTDAPSEDEPNGEIVGICQMPNPGQGGGFLIGVETTPLEKGNYKYEILILDCTLLARGEDAWIYTTGKFETGTNSAWIVWQPEYGYYWTLFRIYDEKDNLLDEKCYGFQNI